MRIRKKRNTILMSYSPIGLSSRDLQSQSRDGKRLQPSRRRSRRPAQEYEILPENSSQLSAEEFGSISPVFFIDRQGPSRESKYVQSPFEVKIGANRYLRVIWELADDAGKALLTAVGIEIARNLPGVVHVEDGVFPPNVRYEGTNEYQHITTQLPIFLRLFMADNRVRQIVNNTLQEVRRLGQDKDMERLRGLIGDATLSSSKKGRSPRTSSELDKLQYVSVNDDGTYREVKEEELKNLRNLLFLPNLGTISRQPLAMALVKKKGKFNDRTIWTNPSAIAEVRAGAGKIARLNAEASYLKTRLLQKMEDEFKKCIRDKNCNEQNLLRGSTLTKEEVADNLYRFNKANSLASLRAKSANIRLILLNPDTEQHQRNRLERLLNDNEAKIDRLLRSERRPSQSRRSRRQSRRRSQVKPESSNEPGEQPGLDVFA